MGRLGGPLGPLSALGDQVRVGTASAQIKVFGVPVGSRLDPAFMTFDPAAARGGLPNLVKAVMDAAVGVIVMSHLVRYAAGLCVAGYGALQLLGRQAGSTRQERRQTLAGDAAVLHPHAVTDHAITIGAPPETVWPWLTQMGWHLGGYYTPRWVDRLLFPANLPSADVLDPDLVRDLAVGDTIPDGPPGTAWYVVEEVGPPRTLVLHSTTHVPPSWREKFGAAIDWTWSFHLTGLPDDRTRLHVRVRGRAAPWWLAAAYITAIIPADFIMATGMLRGLKRRAEQPCIASAPARPAADPRSSRTGPW